MRSSFFIGLMLMALPLAALAAQTPSQAYPHNGSGNQQQLEHQALRTELEQLRSAVRDQERQIQLQKGALDVYAQRKDGSNTAIYAAVFAAIIGGIFAVRNQNQQAAQERLLKAVELIMDSRSGYQADIRRKNLEVFLNDETKKHLEGIRGEFSGSEFTELHVALAEAMSEKVSTPAEVLEIWKCVLKGKKFFDKIEYSRPHETET